MHQPMTHDPTEFCSCLAGVFGQALVPPDPLIFFGGNHYFFTAMCPATAMV